MINIESELAGKKAPTQPIEDSGGVDVVKDRDETLGDKQTGEKRKKQKVIKQNSEANLVLGVDVQIEEAMEVAEHTVVGRARGKNFSTQFIQNWVE